MFIVYNTQKSGQTTEYLLIHRCHWIQFTFFILGNVITVLILAFHHIFGSVLMGTGT